MSNKERPTQETMGDGHGHLLCWTSVSAGLLIAMMSFVLLMAAGGALAGATAEGLVNVDAIPGLGLLSIAGVWVGLAMVISLFFGTYFALRVSRFVTAKVGAAHGFVIATLFFALAMIAGASGVGGALGGLGSIARGAGVGAGRGAASLSGNPLVQDTIHKVIGDSSLKSPPSEVVQGLLVRLAQGDTESIKSYLSYQTGKSEEEIDQRVGHLKTEYQRIAHDVAESAARGVTSAGVTLLVVLLAGLLGAVIGGRVGAHANFDRPFAKSNVLSVGVRAQRGSVIPYILGWLVGVPVSLLVVIAAVRTLF